jgi:hypothetical protein
MSPTTEPEKRELPNEPASLDVARDSGYYS